MDNTLQISHTYKSHPSTLTKQKKLKLDIFSLKKVEKCDIEKNWQH